MLYRNKSRQLRFLVFTSRQGPFRVGGRVLTAHSPLASSRNEYPPSRRPVDQLLCLVECGHGCAHQDFRRRRRPQQIKRNFHTPYDDDYLYRTSTYPINSQFTVSSQSSKLRKTRLQPGRDGDNDYRRPLPRRSLCDPYHDGPCALAQANGSHGGTNARVAPLAC